MDCETIANGDADLDRFLSETGYVDPEAGPVLEEDDDNHNLDLDLDADDLSVDEDLLNDGSVSESRVSGTGSVWGHE